MAKLQDRLDRLKKKTLETAPADALAIMAHATEHLRASGIMDRLPAVGSTLPAFRLPDADGNVVASSELLAKGPLVITFYRGFW